MYLFGFVRSGEPLKTAMLVFLLAAMTSARAQNSPRIGYAYPAGGRQGSSFEVVLGGQFLDGATNVHFSGPGISAIVLDHNKPLTQQQFTYLRDKLKVLLDKKQAGMAGQTNGSPARGDRLTHEQTNGPAAGGSLTNVSEANAAINDAKEPPTKAMNAAAAWTDEDQKMVADISKKLSHPPSRQANPAIAETVRILIEIAPDAAPGERELRLLTPMGLSNPRVFCVGRLPEYSRKAARGGGAEARSLAAGEVKVVLPAVLNGQIMPGSVDRYRFWARKGQRLVFCADARQLIPYLPNAAPGWFQAVLILRNGAGKELASASSFRFHPDPLLFGVIPFDGDYQIEIRDATLRGREDFVYRLHAGELPFVTDIFPLGGQAGRQTTVALQGVNLPVLSVRHEARDQEPGVHAFSGVKPGWLPSEIPFETGTLSECLEGEPNNDLRQAQPLNPPIVVNGCIARPGDRDVFHYSGRAGEVVVAEVMARRLNSPLDSMLTLLDSAGNQLAINDDHEAREAGLNTHHADSWLGAVLPADGDYYLQLTDSQQKGGPEYSYRLRLSPPRPDYELRVVPSAINARPGATVPVDIFALRKDGFTNEIALSLKGAPAGFSLDAGRVPAGADHVRCTVTFPAEPLPQSVPLRLEGLAVVQERELNRPGMPAEDMMQAFRYRHLVPARQWVAANLEGDGVRAPLRIVGASALFFTPEGLARIQVSTPPRFAQEKAVLQVFEPAEGIVVRQVSPVPGGVSVLLACDPVKFRPGRQGNLILAVYPRQAGAAARGQNNRLPPMSCLPAIRYEISGP
jgi:hypothetical protein